MTRGGWLGDLFFWGPTIIAYVTVFYMARSFALTFLGKPRDQNLYDHAHEAPKSMTIPQIILAAMAVLSAPLFWPFWHTLIVSSEPGVLSMQSAEFIKASHGMHETHVYLLNGFAWIIMLAAGILFYRNGFTLSSRVASLPVIKQLYTWAYNKFYFDALYDVFTVNAGKTIAFIAGAVDKWIVDGTVNAVALLGRGSAFLSGRFDNVVIDGAVNGAATFARSGGSMLRSTQVGRIRTYVLLLFASATLVTLVVVMTVMVMT